MDEVQDMDSGKKSEYVERQKALKATNAEHTAAASRMLRLGFKGLLQNKNTGTCVPNFNDTIEPDLGKKLLCRPDRKELLRNKSGAQRNSKCAETENLGGQYNRRYSLNETTNGQHPEYEQSSNSGKAGERYNRSKSANDTEYVSDTTYNNDSAYSSGSSMKHSPSFNLETELSDERKCNQFCSSSYSCNGVSTSHVKGIPISAGLAEETYSFTKHESLRQENNFPFHCDPLHSESNSSFNDPTLSGSLAGDSGILHNEIFSTCFSADDSTIFIPPPHPKCDTLVEEFENEIKSCDSSSQSDSDGSSFDDVLKRAASQTSSLDEDELPSSGSDIFSECLPEPNQEQIDSITELLDSVNESEGVDNYDDAPKLVEYLNTILKKFSRGSSAQLYGSYQGGYAVKSSYVDLELEIEATRSTESKVLNELAKYLNNVDSEYEAKCEEVENSKSEKLVFFDVMYDLPCEVKILARRKTAYDNSKLIKFIFNHDERVETLVIAARHWAKVCRLLEAEEVKKRLHPLWIALLVIHFLQQHHPQVLDIVDVKFPLKMGTFKENKQSVGELWLAFLKYYSMTFNWRDHVVNIRSREPVLKSSKSWGICWIGIEDPHDVDENLAQAIVSQDFSHYVKTCFLHTCQYFFHPIPIEKVIDECDASLKTEEGISERNKNPQYNYEFCIGNFTDGSEEYIFCAQCDELGFICQNCADGQIAGIAPLPKMTPEFLKILNESLMAVYEENKLKVINLEVRDILMFDLQSYVRKRFPDAILEYFGSSANGFGFFNSDLDICMTFSKKSEEEIEKKYIVRELCRHLRKNKEYNVLALYKANVPLVKFFHTSLKLRGDISLYNILAVYNTKLLYTYSLIDPRVSVLGCAMKFLAKNAGIADSANRCLSSYSYILLVIYFLQQTKPPVLPVLQALYDRFEPCPEILVDGCNVWFFRDIENLSKVWKDFGQNNQSVGELWLDLLNFYADFECERVIAIHRKDPILTNRKNHLAILLNIIDPFITNLNLGRKLSGEMRLKTHKTLLRARNLFGIPRGRCPTGFESFKEFFFHTLNLTDGRVKKLIECEICGKPGHTSDSCPRTFTPRGGFRYRNRRGARG